MHAIKAYGKVEFHSVLNSAQDGVEQSASHTGCLKKGSPIPTNGKLGGPGIDSDKSPTPVASCITVPWTPVFMYDMCHKILLPYINAFPFLLIM